MLAKLNTPAATGLGIMIETPASAVLAAQLAHEADFFSIGSNDLTQYTLAMDRATRQSRARSTPSTPRPHAHCAGRARRRHAGQARRRVRWPRRRSARRRAADRLRIHELSMPAGAIARVKENHPRPQPGTVRLAATLVGVTVTEASTGPACGGSRSTGWTERAPERGGDGHRRRGRHRTGGHGERGPRRRRRGR